MSLRDELPVERLADDRWERIEEGLFAELDAELSVPPSAPARRHGSRRLLVASVAGAFIAAAGILFWLQIDEPRGEQPLSPTRIASGEGSAEANVGDAVVRLSPETALSVLGDEATGFVVIMEAGEATFVVPPRGERPPFVVQAGPTRVEVVGTEFSVAYETQTTVSVAEGTVRVSHGGAGGLVHAGESWSSASAPASEMADPSTEDMTDNSGEARAAAPVEEPLRVRPNPPAAERPGYDARARFEEASQLEPTAPARAIAIYAELARRGGSWGEVALYAQARAELERGDEDAAGRLFRRYLRLHPNGENAADSRELLRTLP